MRRLGMHQTTSQSLKTKTSLSLERFGVSEALNMHLSSKNQDAAGNLKASGSGNHSLEHSRSCQPPKYSRVLERARALITDRTCAVQKRKLHSFLNTTYN